jgi:ribosome-associated toxin RatA of RatAB toxin-antitoxin module
VALPWMRGAMNEIRKSALVAYPAERIFDLIEAAEHYPEFLPWCAAATILTRDEDTVSARITIDYHGVRLNFATRNPKRRPDYMAIHLEHGPFRHFQGEWHLARLAEDACRIEFALSYEFKNPVTAKLAAPVLDRIANTLVDAFVARADEVYGTTPRAAPGAAEGDNP